jgi:hypothetical protein
MFETVGVSVRVVFLEEEIARLVRVNEALMNRVERSTDAAGSSFSLFEFNLLLQNKLEEHISLGTSWTATAFVRVNSTKPVHLGL